MSKLTEQQVVQLIREEYHKKVQEVVDELSNFAKIGNEKLNVLSPGLKIRENESGLLYTILTVKPDGVEVMPGEGDPSFISNKELSVRYALD
mgnify:FL=1